MDGRRAKAKAAHSRFLSPKPRKQLNSSRECNTRFRESSHTHLNQVRSSCRRRRFLFCSGPTHTSEFGTTIVCRHSHPLGSVFNQNVCLRPERPVGAYQLGLVDWSSAPPSLSPSPPPPLPPASSTALSLSLSSVSLSFLTRVTVGRSCNSPCHSYITPRRAAPLISRASPSCLRCGQIQLRSLQFDVLTRICLYLLSPVLLW